MITGLRRGRYCSFPPQKRCVWNVWERLFFFLSCVDLYGNCSTRCCLGCIFLPWWEGAGKRSRDLIHQSDSDESYLTFDFGCVRGEEQWKYLCLTNNFCWIEVGGVQWWRRAIIIRLQQRLLICSGLECKLIWLQAWPAAIAWRHIPSAPPSASSSSSPLTEFI